MSLGNDASGLLRNSIRGSEQRPCLLLGSQQCGKRVLPSRIKISVGRKTIRSYSVRMSQQDSGTNRDILDPVPDYVFPQNLDLPPVYPTNKKRPYVRPIKLVLRESRRRRKLGIVPEYWKAPRNGLLVSRLIPVAHEVMKQMAILEEGVAKLMEVIPVKACSCCSQIHVGAAGHMIKSCKGSGSTTRNGFHAWIRGFPHDVLIPVDTYHVLDRLGPPIIHDQKFSVPRLPAITELCIQAGVEHPDYPVVRWARTSGRQVGDGRAQVAEKQLLFKYPRSDADENSDVSDNEEGGDGQGDAEDGSRVELKGKMNEDDDADAGVREDGIEFSRKRKEMGERRICEAEDLVGDGGDGVVKDEVKTNLDHESLEVDSKAEDVDEAGAQDSASESIIDSSEIEVDPEKEELVAVAERTMRAFHAVRKGVQTLMKAYPIRACGYCPEVHVGPRGHRVKLCGAFKHQQRKGKHGWQEAALSDVFPPNFVWHVPEGHDPVLRAELRRYYGQAPAVVELCVQAGARVPLKWRPFMRTDVVIPEVDERYFVF